MAIEVEGPDGQVHQFDNGTPRTTINQRLGQIYPDYAETSGGFNLEPLQPPGAGSATVSSGAVMPNSRAVPPRLGNEDWGNLIMAMAFPGIAGVLQHTPGMIYRGEVARAIGQEHGKREATQEAGAKVLDQLYALRNIANQAGMAPPDPRNPNAPRRQLPEGQDALLGAIGPVDSNDWFQRGREAVNFWDWMGTNRSYNVHNALLHEIDGVVTAFARAGAAAGMSDERQRLFNDTIGRMMRATSRDEFNSITRSAENIIRNTFSLQPGAHLPGDVGSNRASSRTGPGNGQQVVHAIQVGDVRRGFEYLGGDPGEQGSWRRVSN